MALRCLCVPGISVSEQRKAVCLWTLQYKERHAALNAEFPWKLQPRGLKLRSRDGKKTESSFAIGQRRRALGSAQRRTTVTFAGSEGPQEAAFIEDEEGKRPNPFQSFLKDARAAWTRIRPDAVSRDVLALALPAAVTGMADPMVQLTETALMSRIAGHLNLWPSHVFTGDDLGLQIAAIAWPALLALAADPLASLTDTYFIGRIGAVELASVGVSVSVFNLISKVFNFPLLNITTSFVAEDEEKATAKENALDDSSAAAGVAAAVPRHKPVLPSVSSALVLGTALGVFEALMLIFGAGSVLDVMGVPPGSGMRDAATDYLAWRAVGAPAVVVALATQGVFRGFKDTKTPLYTTVGANLINVVLDPVLMFSCGYGVTGAAVATVIAQYAQAGVLLWRLSKRVTLLPPRLSDLRLGRFVASGGLLLGRTLALLSTMTLATSMAARQGSTPMAAHQICMQIWLAASLLSDSVALAGQTMIASAFARGDHERAKKIMYRTLQLGMAMGLAMAMVLSLGASTIPRVFTKDAGVLEMTALIFPFVAATQPITSLAFVFDGIHYGASDFAYAASTMIVLVIPVTGVLIFAPQFLGLGGVWMGLTLIMSARMFAGFYRVGTASGPWRILRIKAPPDIE